MVTFVEPKGLPKSLVALAALTMAMATATLANADTFRVSGGIPGSIGGCGGSFDISSSAPVSGAAACAVGHNTQMGSANAGFGAIGASASATSAEAFPAAWGSNAVYSTNLLFTSSDPTATTALVQANIALAGIMDVLSSVPDFDAGVLVIGTLSMSGLFSEFKINNRGFIRLSEFTVASGILNPVSGKATEAILRTSFVNVPLNVLVPYQITLSSGALAVGSGHRASANFGDTFEVPIGSNAFELDPGVTVNAGSWLVNNRRLVPSMGGVPEPASWALMLAGFGLVGGAMRRRTRARRVRT